MAIPEKDGYPTKGVISRSKITPIFDKAREKTGTTNKYTLGDIPGIMDELEKISVWEGTKEESNTTNLDITENNYNVLTNKNKITFNTAQQKLTDLLNVYFTIEVSTTEEMNAFLEESTVGRVFKYVGETNIFTNGSYYKVNDNNEYEEVVVLNLQEKTATPTKDQQEITPDSTYNGLGKVVVEPIPDNYIEPSGTLAISENGTKDVTQYASVEVNVESGGGSGGGGSGSSGAESIAITFTTDYLDPLEYFGMGYEIDSYIDYNSFGDDHETYRKFAEGTTDTITINGPIKNYISIASDYGPFNRVENEVDCICVTNFINYEWYAIIIITGPNPSCTIVMEGT